MWCLALSGIAAAVEPRLEGSLGASGWALGLRGQFRPGFTQHLWGEHDDILFKDTYVRGLADISATPSYARIGPEIGFSPIAVFEMRASVVWSEYFGTFSSVIGFEDADAVPSAEALQREADLGYRDHGWGVRYSGGATLQAQFGPVVIYMDGALRHWITHPGPAVRGAYFYEPRSRSCSHSRTRRSRASACSASSCPTVGTIVRCSLAAARSGRSRSSRTTSR
jgi:hypothetical protein